MQRYFPLVLIAIIGLLSPACEEVIELELDTSEQRLVIEANLNATTGLCQLKLSLSGGFYESNDFEKINGAEVVLTTSSGGNYLLGAEGNGIYTAQNIAIQANESAYLKITTPDGAVYNASATTPAPVALDTLLVEKNEGNPMGGDPVETYELTAKWQDIQDMENFYRLKIYRNGAFQSDLLIMTDDRLGDGAVITRPIIRQQYALGDTLRCELLACDLAYYQYFSDIFNAEGRGPSAPVPFNPVGNFDNNALGYFGIWYLSEKIIVVQ